MGWFRPRAKFRAWLALAAIALNLAVAFGHHHFEDAPASAGHSSVAGHTDDADHDGSAADHPCFTCAVVLVADGAVSPPVLPSQSWTHTADVAAATASGPRQSDRTSFEARAPPQA
jgi:hypothetical protein